MLSKTLENPGYLCVISNPTLDIDDFFYYFAAQLGLLFDGNKAKFLFLFSKLLEECKKTDRKVLTSKVASDLGIPLRAKLFQLVPQVFDVQPLKAHSTLRSNVNNLIDERNIVMHMQSKLSLEDQDLDRVSYAVKLFKTNSFLAPELVLKYVKYIYSKSEIPIAPWVNVAGTEIEAIKKGLK